MKPSKELAVIRRIKKRIENYKKNGPQVYQITKKHKYSFGIYLSHALFVGFVLYKDGINPFPIGHKKLELLLFVAATIAIYIGSYLLTWIMSKIPLLRKTI